jgi:hypothetical protein
MSIFINYSLYVSYSSLPNMGPGVLHKVHEFIFFQITILIMDFPSVLFFLNNHWKRKRRP